MLSRFKPYIEHYPILAMAYRSMRDAWILHRETPVSTQYGFKLAGNRETRLGLFEPAETALIQELLAEADVFVDVGANIGYYTCLALSRGKYAIAIEPLPQNLNYLYMNLRANGWGNVEVFPLGVGHHPGIATMYGASTGASLINGWAGAAPSHRRTISLSTLDILLGTRFNGKKLIIKVDVEGAEYYVLQGARHVLTLSPRPVWLVEISVSQHHPSGLNPNCASTFELFLRNGYEARTASPERRFISPAEVERAIESRQQGSLPCNFMFIAKA